MAMSPRPQYVLHTTLKRAAYSHMWNNTRTVSCCVQAAPQFTEASRPLPVIISESSQAPGWLNTFFCSAAISHLRSATMHHTIALQAEDGDWKLVLYPFQKWKWGLQPHPLPNSIFNASSFFIFYLFTFLNWPYEDRSPAWNGYLISFPIINGNNTHRGEPLYHLLSDRPGSVSSVLMKKLHEVGAQWG